MSASNEPPGLPGKLAHVSRPKPSERRTRAHVPVWDRIRIFLALVGAFLLIVWAQVAGAALADPPQDVAFREALRDGVRTYWWLLALAALEVLRQLHYLIQESSPGYYRWTNRVSDRRREASGRMNPWVRYRLSRLFKLLFMLLVLDLVIAAFSSDPRITPWNALFLAPALAVQAMPIVLQLAFAFFFVIFQFIGLFWFLSRGGIDTIMPDEIETRFDDVKGQDAALAQLKETLVFLERPEEIEKRGGYVPGGILLWGPPGTGKTLMAQAISGETGRPFVAVEPSAFINMFMGVGALKVKGLYRKLRKLAMRYGGVIVFFDEADSLGSRGAGVATGFDPARTPWSALASCNGIRYASPAARASVMADLTPAEPEEPQPRGFVMGGMGGGGGMGTLQALLSEMSGLTKPRGLLNRIRKLLGMKPTPPPKYRILHIFATNMPDALDPAMLRPGRVDRMYKVGYPQKDGRVATFRYYLRKIDNDLTDEQVDKLATVTPYFSGASIKDIVNEGLVIAMREGRETVMYADIVKAKQLKQHGLPDDHEYIERERHSVAVHEACHAVAEHRLSRHTVIDIATIERRGDIGGFVSPIPVEDQFVQWRSEREIDVMTFLASLAGERIFFDGDHSMGVGGDMRAATALSTQDLAFYAMGDTLVSRSVTLAAIRGAQPVETGTDRALFDSEFGRAVDARLRELYDRVWVLLEQNRTEVLAVAHALEVHKTITGDDIAAVIDGRKGPTIDGRSYQDARFKEELEAYHRAVLAAHKEHTGVEGSVPIPVPPAPVDVLPDGSRAAWQSGVMVASPVDPPTPEAR
jgi:ATP-dependent Zn protease